MKKRGITHADIPAFTKDVGTVDVYFIVWYETAKAYETATCETVEEVQTFLATLEDVIKPVSGPVKRVAIQRIVRTQAFNGTLADARKAYLPPTEEKCGHPGCPPTYEEAVRTSELAWLARNAEKPQVRCWVCTSWHSAPACTLR